MQSNESPKVSYGSKRNALIIFSIVWLILGAIILEWLPLIPAKDTSVPDNYVTLDVSSGSLKTRGESGNIHLFIGETEYILPTGQTYDTKLISDAGLEGKLLVDVDNIHVRTPEITGFGAYLNQLIAASVPGFKLPAGVQKVLDMIPLTTGYKMVPAKSFFAFTFNKNAEYYYDDDCTVVIYKDFYWIMDGTAVKEVRGNNTTVFEHRSSAVKVLSSDKVSDDGHGNIVVKKSFFNRISVARALGMLDPMSIIIAALYILPLIFLFRAALNAHSLYMEDIYAEQGIPPVQRHAKKLETLKTVFIIVGAVWFGGYLVTMLLNMFAIGEEPMRQVLLETVADTKIQVMGLTVNKSVLAIPTGLFFHIPTTLHTMTGYVEMFLSISSLAINAAFGLFPALLLGSMSKDTNKSLERFHMHSAAHRK